VAEYKKEAGLFVTIAVVGVLVLAGVSAYLFPSFSGSFGGVNTGSTSQSTSGVSTTTAYTASTTIPSPQTYTNETVSPDPRLAVTPMDGLLGTSNNATLIAGDVASYFNELPITLVKHQPATCSASSTVSIPGIPAGQNCRETDYPYSTAIDFYKFNGSKGSVIYVDLFQGKFLELQYIVKNYTALHDSSVNYTNPSSAVASAKVANLIANAYGIDLSKFTLGNIFAGDGSNRVSWYQTYQGMQISDGGGIYFEYYPPTSQIIWLVVNMDFGWGIQPPWSFNDLGRYAVGIGGWNQIPSSITLNLSSSVALAGAKTYAENTLHMGFIGYSSIELALVSGHLYYAATVANQSNTYVLFVNPITGEVGYPIS
jgi:hypothetical protein